MKIQRTKGEFMLLPTFSIDSWWEPDLELWQHVYTIGWGLWFIRWFKNI